MLNRLVIVIYIEKLFDKINNISYSEYKNIISENHKEMLPDDIENEINKHYYNILLNNKDISIDDQIDMVNNFYYNFKIYLNETNGMDNLMKSKLYLIDLELPIIFKFLKSRNTVRKIRKGYK